jgi:predicted Rossmann fold nucleotide-binding protein DprA/Smf involved in DNA uptake
VLAAVAVDPAPSAAPNAALDPRLETIRAAISSAPVTADELVRSTGVCAGEIAAALAELELLGAVVQHDGVYREVMHRGA